VLTEIYGEEDWSSAVKKGGEGRVEKKTDRHELDAEVYSG
jgi:hypothetical protein